MGAAKTEKPVKGHGINIKRINSLLQITLSSEMLQGARTTTISIGWPTSHDPSHPHFIRTAWQPASKVRMRLLNNSTPPPTPMMLPVLPIWLPQPLQMQRVSYIEPCVPSMVYRIHPIEEVIL